jgi:(2Fe-2S) ferredoxin
MSQEVTDPLNPVCVDPGVSESCRESLDRRESLDQCVTSLGIDRIQRHVFLCADQTKPLCCSQEAGLEAWNYLKNRLRELDLDKPTRERPTCIFRTKANCLRVCSQGPIFLVYPDGIWYRATTPDVIERIIQDHLIGNQVVEEYAFLRHPLPATDWNAEPPKLS